MAKRMWGDVLADEKKIAQRQRESARELAGKLESSRQITRADAMFVAAILRGWADRPEVKPKRGRGQAVQFSHSEAALTVALFQRQGKRDAVVKAAEIYGVSVQSIRKAMRENADEVQR